MIEDAKESLISRLKEEIKELRITNDIQQSDLVQQQLATEKQKKKYENDIENMRSRLKVSQN